MQMSLSGFLTFIYPHAAHYSRVENCKLERERTNGIEPDTENENKIKKKKKKESQKCPACPKAVLLSAIRAILNIHFFCLFTAVSQPTAPCQWHNLNALCALS